MDNYLYKLLWIVEFLAFVASDGRTDVQNELFNKGIQIENKRHKSNISEKHKITEYENLR